MTLSRRALSVGLGTLVICQGLLFWHFCATQIVPAFPRGYDQTAYLGISYDMYEAFHVGGVQAGLAEIGKLTAPQGILLEIEAGLAQVMLGPGRMPALLLNFAHLTLFEIALVVVCLWMRRPALGLALSGLLLSAASLYHDMGGMPDFRLDFAAFCVFGVLVCVAIRARLFRFRAWTVVFGVWVAALLLIRTIYLAYVAPGLALWLGVLLMVRHRPGVEARARLTNLTIAALIPALLWAPSLLLRWQAILAYYVYGHRSNEAALRAREFGVFSSWDHLTYYPRSVIDAHAGWPFLVLAAIVLLALFAGWRRDTVPDDAAEQRAGRALTRADALLGLVWLTLTAVATYLVLTADVSKSPIVGGVFIAMALPAMPLWAILMRSPNETGWRVAALLLVCAAGQAIFVAHMRRQGNIPVDSADMRDYGAMMDTMTRLSANLNRHSPMVSFDALTEYSHVGVLKAMAFERLGVSLSPVPGLGAIELALPAITQSEADARLERSDFAVIGKDRDPNGDEVYPVNASLRRLAPHLYEKASREMVRVRDANFFGRHVTLFMKPTMKCDGESGGWITSSGLDCHTTGAVLTARPIVRVRGAAYFTYLSGSPNVTARIAQDDRPTATRSCTLTPSDLAAADPRPYAIDCDVRDLFLTSSQPVTLSLRFDRYFVPKQRGMNEDTRQLVFPMPTSIDMVPATPPEQAAK